MTKVFSYLPVEDRDKLAQLVAEHAQALEKGLRVLKHRVKGGEWGPMDLLALDAKGRPVIIDVAPLPGDQLLVEGLAHVAWLRQNQAQVATLLENHEGNTSFQHRLILVAPDFSDTLQKAAGGLEALVVDLYRFRLLEADDEKALLVESVFSSAATEKISVESEESISLSEGIIPLAEEEIATFMNMDPRFTLE
jgi:RecB family endonuclease NucS